MFPQATDDLTTPSADSVRQVPIRLAQGLVLFLIGLTPSCLSLTGEPWSRFEEGANVVELSTGLSKQRLTYELEGESGSLSGLEVSQSEELRGEYAIGVRGLHHVTDDWSVGGGLEWWRHKSNNVDFGNFELTSEPFGYLRYLLATRYLLPSLGSGPRASRWRPFVDAELFYVADLDADFVARFDSAAQTPESVRFEGHGFYGYSLGAGLAALVADDTLIEVGGRWVQDLSKAEDEIDLQPPQGESSQIEMSLEPEGWTFYVALTYSF